VSVKSKVGTVLNSEDLMCMLQLVTMWPGDMLEFKVQCLIQSKILIPYKNKEGDKISGVRINYAMLDKIQEEAKKELERQESKAKKAKPKVDKKQGRRGK